MREHRTIKKTPFCPNDGMNFSAEKGTVIARLGSCKTLLLCLLSYSLSKVGTCAVGAEIFYMYNQSI